MRRRKCKLDQHLPIGPDGTRAWIEKNLLGIWD